MKNKYPDGSEIKVGDIITDGANGREIDRLRRRAKILYIDKHTVVWFPLNEHSTSSSGDYKSFTWCLTERPKKVEISELDKQELDLYNNSDKYL